MVIVLLNECRGLRQRKKTLMMSADVVDDVRSAYLNTLYNNSNCE